MIIPFYKDTYWYYLGKEILPAGVCSIIFNSDETQCEIRIADTRFPMVYMQPITDYVRKDGTPYNNKDELLAEVGDFFVKPASSAGGYIDGEVNTFADLPDASQHLAEAWIVLQTTGVWILGTRKSSGLYISDGVNWNLASNELFAALQPGTSSLTRLQWNDSVKTWEAKKPVIMYQAVDTNGGQDINQITPVPITLATVQYNDSEYFQYVSLTQIRILKAGTYKFSYKIAGGDNVTSRRDVGGAIRINSQIVNETVSQDYVRNTSNNEFAVSCPAFSVVVAAGSIIELVGFRLGDAGQALTKSTYSFIRIEYQNF